MLFEDFNKAIRLAAVSTVVSLADHGEWKAEVAA
jgi:hypothetical protein